MANFKNSEKFNCVHLGATCAAACRDHNLYGVIFALSGDLVPLAQVALQVDRGDGFKRRLVAGATEYNKYQAEKDYQMLHFEFPFFIVAPSRRCVRPKFFTTRCNVAPFSF